MYEWRKLTDAERSDVLASRVRAKRPWHSPPRVVQECAAWFHVTAACYEHLPIIGHTPERMEAFAGDLVGACSGFPVAAWCLLPNHYHVLVETPNLRMLTKALGRIHGRFSRMWNLEEKSAGRTVFHRAADRQIRSDAHFWATLNYVHHNPVRHGYVKRWTDWPWSSASDYLRAVGRDEAARIWLSYPVLDYGDGWDDSNC
jgi:putative transposase